MTKYLRKITLFITAVIIFSGLTGCKMFHIKQNVATDKYPVSASDSLFDENGNILHGPRNLKIYLKDSRKPTNPRFVSNILSDLEQQGLYSDLDFYTERVEALEIIKRVRVSKKAWHWMAAMFGNTIDFRESINEEIEACGGEGMINFHFFAQSPWTNALSYITFQIIPWYTNVGYEADIVKRKVSNTNTQTTLRVLK